MSEYLLESEQRLREMVGEIKAESEKLLKDLQRTRNERDALAVQVARLEMELKRYRKMHQNGPRIDDPPPAAGQV